MLEDSAPDVRKMPPGHVSVWINPMRLVHVSR